MFPLFGLEATLRQSLGIGAIFTLVSLVRGYCCGEFSRRCGTVEEVKRDGWHEQGALAVVLDDERLTWSEGELVQQLGEKLYGKRDGAGEWLSGRATWSRSGSPRRRQS